MPPEATRRLIRDQARSLREACPPLLPVRVYFRKIAEAELAWGMTELKFSAKRPSRFVITLDSRLSPLESTLILMHEWAHCLAWRQGDETICDHDAEWGLAYSRVYQELMAL